MSDPREYDIVVLGATGFTGGLVADYLAAHAPAAARITIAGRNREKLDAVRTRLAAIDPRWSDMEPILVDLADEESLRAMARRTRVVVTTVGPYLLHGEPVVAACAAEGTDYADITGEPEFVDQMFNRYHDQAVASGARLVHACGFDAMPHDLGVYFTMKHVDASGPVTVRGVVRAGGTPSGGTMQSALEQMSRMKQSKAAFSERLRKQPKDSTRSSRAVSGKPHRDPILGYWLLPLPTIDPQIVARSGAALSAYGPRFRYSHWAGTRTLRYALGGAAFVSGVAAAAQVKPLRERLAKRFEAGQGPSESRRAKSWFAVHFVAEDANGNKTRTKVSGGDPGYTETSKMLSQAALSLAFDDNPKTAGQVTTAQAMGDHLIERLQREGMRFEQVPLRD